MATAVAAYFAASAGTAAAAASASAIAVAGTGAAASAIAVGGATAAAGAGFLGTTIGGFSIGSLISGATSVIGLMSTLGEGKEAGVNAANQSLLNDIETGQIRNDALARRAETMEVLNETLAHNITAAFASGIRPNGSVAETNDAARASAERELRVGGREARLQEVRGDLSTAEGFAQANNKRRSSLFSAVGSVGQFLLAGERRG